CGAACSIASPCGDGAGVCELDAGVCVQCNADVDCTDPSRPHCDPMTRLCFPCLPTADTCATGLYCGTVTGNAGTGYTCVPGCKNNNDCAPGGGDDAGIPDGGDDGGVDAGVPSATPVCDTTMHACVG